MFWQVLRGGVLPADGVVLRGCGTANEALVTGESLPVPKEPGAHVIGGSTLLTGPLLVEVTAVGEDSLLRQIVQLVEGAQGRKAPIQQLADRLAAHFTAFMLSSAAAVLVLWLALLYTHSVSPSLLPSGRSRLDVALTLALSTLVVACPCALGLRCVSCITWHLT